MKEKLTLLGIAAIALIIGFLIGFGVRLSRPVPDNDTDLATTIEEEVANATKELNNKLDKKESKLEKTESELEQAKSKLENAESELEETKSKLKKSKAAKSSVYEEAFNTIFPDTGEKFVMNNTDFRFYSDRSCSPDTLITEKLTFVNFRDEEGENASGFKVFVTRSTEGPVFSVEQPLFDPAN